MAPRQPERYEKPRFYSRIGFEGLLRNPPVRPKNRSRASLRKATLSSAAQVLDLKARLLRKDPEALLASFTKHFDESGAIDELRRDRRLEMIHVRRCLTYLVNDFDDGRVKSEPGWSYFGLSRRSLPTAELRRRARLLDGVAAILREGGRIAVAESVETVGELYRAAVDTSPQGLGSRQKGPGAKRKEEGDLAEALDLFLDPLPGGDRSRLVAALVSDFRRPMSADQIRSLLKERYRREQQAHA